MSKAAEITVRVIREGSNALPEYETADSAGMDLRAHLKEALTLDPGERALVPTGMRLEIPPTTLSHPCPRQSWPSHLLLRCTLPITPLFSSEIDDNVLPQR